MKVTGLFTILATALAVSATTSPAAELDDRAATRYNAREAAALESQTRSTINQIRNIQRSYDNRVRSTMGDWRGSAKTAIQRELQEFAKEIGQANKDLDQIADVLARLH